MDRSLSALPEDLRTRLLHRTTPQEKSPFVVDDLTIERAGTRLNGSGAFFSVPSPERTRGLTSTTRFVIDTAIIYAIADTTRRIFSFNDRSLMAVDRFQMYTGGTWIDTRRLSYTYDDRSRITRSLSEVRVGDSLKPFFRETYTYDARGNPTTGLIEFRDSLTNTLVPSTRSIFFYDAHGDLLLDQYEHVNAGMVQWGIRSTYLRDPEGNELQYCSESWNGGWVPTRRRTTTRDARGHPVSELTQLQQKGVWVNGEKKERTYDPRGNLLVDTRESWWDGAWQPGTRETRAYDEQDSLILITEEIGYGGAYQNGERYTFSYEMGRFQSGMLEGWKDNAWVPYHRWTVDHNSVGDPILTTGWWWDRGDWSFSSRRSSAYDAARRLTGEFTEYWQDGRWLGGNRLVWDFSDNGNPTITQYLSIDSLGQTTYGTREVTTYDERGMLARLTYDEWADGGWQPADHSWAIHDSARVMPSPFNGSVHNQYFFTGYRVELRSSAIGSDPMEPAGISLLQNYPNPFNAGTVIPYTLTAAGMIRLTVFDLLGREVALLVAGVQGPGTFTARFDAPHLPSGVYFSRLQSGSHTETKKMLLLR